MGDLERASLHLLQVLVRALDGGPIGVSVEQLLAGWGKDQTLLGRLPTLAQVADVTTDVPLAPEAGLALGALLGWLWRRRVP